VLGGAPAAVVGHYERVARGLVDAGRSAGSSVAGAARAVMSNVAPRGSAFLRGLSGRNPFARVVPPAAPPQISLEQVGAQQFHQSQQGPLGQQPPAVPAADGNHGDGSQGSVGIGA